MSLQLNAAVEGCSYCCDYFDYLRFLFVFCLCMLRHHGKFPSNRVRPGYPPTIPSCFAFSGSLSPLWSMLCPIWRATVALWATTPSNSVKAMRAYSWPFKGTGQGSRNRNLISSDSSSSSVLNPCCALPFERMWCFSINIHPWCSDRLHASRTLPGLLGGFAEQLSEHFNCGSPFMHNTKSLWLYTRWLHLIRCEVVARLLINPCVCHCKILRAIFFWMQWIKHGELTSPPPTLRDTTESKIFLFSLMHIERGQPRDPGWDVQH